jgi:aspartate carbamoyltransferase regulatory subunit
MITEIMKKTDNMPCIKHNYRQVNNRYKDGKQVTSGGEWVTEIRCEVCDKKFEEPEWKVNITTKADYSGGYLSAGDKTLKAEVQC